MSSPLPSLNKMLSNGLAVAALCVVYALAGTIAHDPWKSVDAINLSIAANFAHGNGSFFANSIVPFVAGEPWLGSPPLYHWVAALFGNLTAALFGSDAWYHGARLASTFFNLIGLGAISLAARGFYGRDAALMAPLLAIGSLGLLVPVHEAQTATVSFAAAAGLLAALAWWEVHPRLAALTIALSLGAGFLGDGLTSLLPNLLIVLLALAYPRWRRVARSEWLLAGMLTFVLLAAWPLALWKVWPTGFSSWLDSEAASLIGTTVISLKRLQLLAWGTWPVLPLAGWTIWIHRYRLMTGRYMLPISLSLAYLFSFLHGRDTGENLINLIATLAILASASSDQLRRGLASAFDWFSTMTLTLAMGLIWLAGIAIHFGIPARIAKNFTVPATGFIAEFTWPAFFLALAASVLWLAALVAMPRTPWRPISRWSIGVVAIWLLLVALCLPWIDYGKSYRMPGAVLREALGNYTGCIEGPSLGHGQRASLELSAGIRNISTTTQGRCNYLLVQTTPTATLNNPGWTELLETSRPGDKNERLRLYRRDAPSGTPR